MCVFGVCAGGMGALDHSSLPWAPFYLLSQPFFWLIVPVFIVTTILSERVTTYLVLVSFEYILNTPNHLGG